MTAIIYPAQNRNALFDSIEALKVTSNKDSLWEAMHRVLRPFGIGGVLHGISMFPQSGSLRDFVRNTAMRDSFPAGYFDTKQKEGLLETDPYWGWCATADSPLLWTDDRPKPYLSDNELKSLDIDYDFGLISGVSIPYKFSDGLGVSSIGLHAPDMTWSEFDLLWGNHGCDLLALTAAYDIAMRENHIGQVFSLSLRERECLLWLAAGLRPQQIADRFHTHEKTVEKQIASARHKLKADTVPQAVAKALIFGLITP